MDVSLIAEPEPKIQQLGKYRLVATLGQGGMGAVYLALASGVGQFRKLLVVKELLPELTRKEGFVEMFLDEARLAARLDHPNVVQTFEAGHEEGRYFLAMEYLDGQPLSALLERLKDRGGLSLAVQLQILSEVLTGLHYAHELRDYDGSSLHVVHRDVSPQNVFITYHGQVKIVDFGVAKAANASALTNPGVFKGKFGYAAPEQILGRPVDARADVFSVGVMLWQAIAGRRFSQAMPTPESFRARATGAEPRIAQVVPDVDPLLADICDSALAVDPEDRLGSAEEFYNDLVDYQILTRSRVESAQIGQLMREVFAEERRVVHQVIEQAMKHDGATNSVVASLPFLSREAEKAPTGLADLSRLIQVSRSRDDEEIRQGYAESMAEPLPNVPLPTAPIRTRTSTVTSFWTKCSTAARRPFALAATGFVGVFVIAWLATAMLDRSESSVGAATAPTTTTTTTTATAPSPQPAAASPLPPSAAEPATGTSGGEPASPNPIAAPSVPAVTAPIEPVRPIEHAAAERDTVDEPGLARQPAESERPRAPVLRVRPEGARTESAASASGDLDMGSDLRSMRRGGRIRIDVEDPYQ